MAVVTWNGSSSTDFATAANWDTGSVPTASDDVIIPDTSSINKCVLDQARNINSFVLAADGEFDGGNTLFIKGKNAAGEAIKAQGKLGDVTDFTIETASAATIILTKQSGSGSFRDLTINHASADITLGAAASLGRNLTVTAGQLNTDSSNNYALTVAGKTTIGPNSGSADQATLTCNGSTMSLGSTKTDGLGLHVQQGGTFVGGSGTHTMGSLAVDNNAAAKFTNTSGVNTLNGHSNDSTRVIIGGALSTCTAAGTITITYAGGGYNFQNGNAALINNLTLNSDVTANLSAATSITGDLTISQGTLTTTASDYALTVTGQVSVTGTLTCNESAINIGSLYITSNGVVNATNQTTTINKETSVSAVGYAVYNEGTFHHNNGLVVIGTDTSTIVYGMEGDDTSGANSNAFYRVQVELDNAAYFCKFRPQAGTVAVKIANDLTVAEGIVSQETATHSFEVDVDVSIEAGGVLGRTDITGANTFGSLTIASSGEYIATTGTTTITSESGSGYAVEVLGTYTPNDGTLKITTDANTFVKILDDVNHLIIEAATATRVYEWVSNTTIQGNLTINAGRFAHYSPLFSLDVQGDCAVNNTGILDGGSGSIEFGSLTIASGGEYRATTGTTTIAGQTETNNLCFTNSGTFTHNGGTLNITGTTWGTSQYAHIHVGSNQDFGNVTIDAGGAGSKYYQFRAGSTTFYFDDLYIKSGILRDYNTNNTFHIRGNLDVGIRGAGGAQAVLFDSDARDNDNTIKLILDGIATVYPDGQFHVAYGTDGTDGCKVGGIRNVGGTVYAVEQE